MNIGELTQEEKDNIVRQYLEEKEYNSLMKRKRDYASGSLSHRDEIITKFCDAYDIDNKAFKDLLSKKYTAFVNIIWNIAKRGYVSKRVAAPFRSLTTEEEYEKYIRLFDATIDFMASQIGELR